MEVKYTQEQKSAIYSRGGSILVGAAAGSGKTTVLVERVKTEKSNIMIGTGIMRPFVSSSRGLASMSAVRT